MPSTTDALKSIARDRARDPLAPITILAPSRLAALQLRRRLAQEHGAIAGVRVEVLPRIAELLAAPALAQRYDGPLARPIGDYLAAQLAREASSGLESVAGLPGFARVLRQSFARLRRGGYSRSDALRASLGSGLLSEVIRLYGDFRLRSQRFYDDQDLFEVAAAEVQARGAAAVAELGAVYVVPPGALSAGADVFLKALRRATGASRYHALDEPSSDVVPRLILAPDPASEAREVARDVLDALEGGAALHEVAVFHGADPSYRSLLKQTFETAGIPFTPMPGMPLSETAAGLGALELASLPLSDYSRTAVFDWLNLAPVLESLADRATSWRRKAGEAGITRGRGLWQARLVALIDELRERAAADEERRDYLDRQAEEAQTLRQFIDVLTADLEPLRARTPARRFIDTFTAIVRKLMRQDAPGMTEVLQQIEQLGTIDKLEGATFDLETFAAALRANLDAEFHREGQLGEGVLVADYRRAAGLSFKHVVLCGAYEGVFPAGAPQEALVEDRYWTELLNANHPFLEDAALRVQRSLEAASRAVACATHGLTWSAPLQAADAGREHYPSQPMLAAARLHDVSVTAATQLRRAPAAAWLHRPPSPLAAMLRGAPLDVTEVRLRQAVALRRQGPRHEEDLRLQPALRLLRARRGRSFSEYDGNLERLAGDELVPHGSVSPTSLELYAACGMRYFLSAVLRLRPPEEPEDRETIAAGDKGSLIHDVLDRFFRRRLAEGRPAIGEAWNDRDREELAQLLDETFEEARRRGRTGLDVFAAHELRRIQADLMRFLEKDSEFRFENGCRPVAIECAIPETYVAGLRLRGFADRIDKTPDSRKAWVIDYKTGRVRPYKSITPDDPLAGGSRLQLPVYLASVPDVDDPRAFYWFITSAGGFERVEYAATEQNYERYQQTLAAILGGVRSGAFPAHSGEEGPFGFENCSYCDFTRLCSVRRDDEFEAKREEIEAGSWWAVGVVARGGPA